jgi:hypothetical protein
MKRLAIISSTDGATEDNRLSELSIALGVSVEVLPYERTARSAQELLSQLQPGPCSLAMHMDTLRQVHRALRPGTTLEQLLDDRFQEVLIYGVPNDPDINGTLSALTDGVIRGLVLQRNQAVRYSFPREASEFCRQLAGHSLLTDQEHEAPVFELRPECGLVDSIMIANERPAFVRLKTEARDIFFLAGRMPNLDKPLDGDTGLGDDCIPLVPPIIFLRRCFAESCWKSSEPAARLIIDDPLLTNTYGALDFQTLKTSMRRLGYGASIAFIPWNHWRSSRRTASRLLGGESNLSICVHGCDHTNHEFRLGSAAVLAQKAALGMQRMAKHQDRVGLSFEDVIVFPQGEFSKAAIPALRSANYLAAVNTTCFPTDSAPGDLKIADFLFPAVTRFEGFPIFQRRYPQGAFGFALDLFLGKPALIVEHHAYFRDSCKAMEGFVVDLRHMEPSLTWPDLSELLMRCNLRRTNHDRSLDIQFFTRRFHFAPKETEERRCRLSKFEPDPDTVERVLVDGRSVSFGFDKDHLTFEVLAVPGQICDIEIVDRPVPAPPIRGFGTAHNARVLVRRGLSEFRDNTLSRHDGLLKSAERIAKALKTTGEA